MILYVDCSRGLACDMLCGALLGLFEDKSAILQEMQDNLPKNISLSADCAKSYDRNGLLFCIRDVDWKLCSHGHGTSFCEVKDKILQTSFSSEIKARALEVYGIIAKAECSVHGEDIEHIHFHEVGQNRAIYGIVCACFLFEKALKLLDVERVVFSPINIGFGKTVCAHGEVDVPAPATKQILKTGIPHFFNGIYGELCTPSGCALAKCFADGYAEQNALSAERESIGLGTKDIGVANGVDAFIKMS